MKTKKRPKQHRSIFSMAEAHYAYRGRGMKKCPRCGKKL